MAELAKPYPGWTPPVVNYDLGECMRQAFACAAGVHPIRINWIEPNPGTRSWDEFWELWCAEFSRHGFTLMSGPVEDIEDYVDGGYWIAIVPSKVKRRGTHAVTMRGSKLHYDSAHRRKRRPRKIYEAIVAVPNGD